jgi:hypothetical protein
VDSVAAGKNIGTQLHLSAFVVRKLKAYQHVVNVKK